jgi:hypothetical protein
MTACTRKETQGTSLEPFGVMGFGRAVSWGELLFFDDNSPFGNPD